MTTGTRKKAHYKQLKSIDESLWQSAKVEATKRGITMREFVEEALREKLVPHEKLVEAARDFQAIMLKFNQMLQDRAEDDWIVSQLDSLLDQAGVNLEQALALAEGKEPPK